MKLTDAAEKVLRKFGQPMHSTEIVEYALKQGWITPKGKTPDHSLQAALWTDIERNGSGSRFRMVGKGRVHRKYWLRYPHRSQQ
jgi:hypothetical protein